jgi:hypothetical protein
MTPELRQQVLDMLWPPGQARHASVWAVLDCARDPAIYRLLLESRLEFLCLYSGKLPRELELVAPHIVELLPGHHFTQRLLDEGWGRAWGIFVRIADPTALRSNLRKLLRVQDEDGRRLLFRFYDPRVFAMFMPICDTEQLHQLMAGVQAYVCEAEQGRACSSFALQQGRLQLATLPLQAAD